MQYKSKKGFSLIELIVVMAVIGILVLLAMPKFMGFTERAKTTEIISNVKQLENASERYYMNRGDWPRLNDTPYTSVQVASFAQKIKDKTGKIVTLDPEGNYYDIDYKKLQKYVQKPRNDINYIIQNPAGDVFYIEGITEIGKNRVPTIPQQPLEPTPNPTPEPNHEVNKNGLVLWYNFSDINNINTSSGIVKDLSDNGFDGQMYDFDNTISSGWVDGSVKFDGINDYIATPATADSYVKPQKFTIELLAYSDDWTNHKDSSLLSCTEKGGWNINVSREQPTGLVFLLYKNSLNFNITSVQQSQLSPGWHLFTATYDGKFMRLYVNGSIVDTFDTGSDTNVHYTLSRLLLGTEAGANETPAINEIRYWNGKIRDIKIYNRALSTEEIFESHNLADKK